MDEPSVCGAQQSDATITRELIEKKLSELYCAPRPLHPFGYICRNGTVALILPQQR
jgi:hypothetical protein